MTLGYQHLVVALIAIAVVAGGLYWIIRAAVSAGTKHRG